MKSETIKIEREKRKTALTIASTELVKEVLGNPLMLGFGALLANHAIYKSGWYKADTAIRVPTSGLAGWLGITTTQSPETSAVNMHDSIALFIMTAGIIASLKSGTLPSNALKVVSG